MLEDLEPLFKIFDTFVCKKVPRKIRDKYMEKLIKSKPLEKFKHRYAQKFFKYNPLFCSFRKVNKNIKLEKGGVRFLHVKAFASITRFKSL